MRPTGRARTLRVLTAAALAVCFAPPAAAQGRFGGPQTQLLRDAARLESQGDLEGAERALRDLLASEPTSTGGLFALERILRAQGDVEEIIPLIDDYLERDADPEVRGMRLRVVGETGPPDSLVAAAERWMAEAPGSTTPYRAVARAYEAALGPDRALEVLRRGRSAIGGGVLAFEIGDVLAAVGDLDGAVDEWAMAVGPAGSDAQDARTRVQALPNGRDRAARRLVGILGRSESVLRLGAAARTAIELRVLPEALELSQRYAGELEGRARASFLEDVGRMADDAELGSVASWAYEELRADASSPGERRQLDLRIVDSSLEAGDTATALQAQRRIAESYSRDSEEGRRAAALVIRLEAATSEPDRLRLAFLDFQRAFPDAPELDALAAAVSVSLEAGGDMDGAAGVLAGMEGPRSSLRRAYIALAAGDLEGGRPMLLRAVSGLPPSEATPIVQLTSLLGRLSRPGAQGLIDASIRERRGGGGDAARGLAEQVGALPPLDRAPLLAEAARMADRVAAPELGAQIRGRILEEHGDSPEAGEAALALARFHAGPGGDRTEAVRLLEELITRSPEAAVAPDARLELARLSGRES